MAERDFLDEMIAKRTARNAEFPALLDAAGRRRELLHALAAQREDQERSQTAVAARRIAARRRAALTGGGLRVDSRDAATSEGDDSA